MGVIQGRERGVLYVKSRCLDGFFGDLQVHIGTHPNLGWIGLDPRDDSIYGLPEQMGGSLSRELPSGDQPPWINNLVSSVFRYSDPRRIELVKFSNRLESLHRVGWGT